ncbi:MAG TPA: ATP-binding protein [Phycisphaerae bacterium]|nr:ATP-binding protein [Phycisphaerae bacterium]
MSQPDRQPDPPGPLSPLAEQLAEISALTGGLAHEIRNPLSTLKVNLQLLDEDWQRVENREASGGDDARDVARRSRTRIASLLKEANRLEQILQDFLVYVGKYELQREPHDLNRIVRELADFYQPQAQAGGIELRLHLADQPIVCDVDANRLKQAVLNLLINAQQAMPDGGRIDLRVTDSAEGARIDVEDSGPGIPPQERDLVFRAYYSTKKGGTGLGLATTHRIIREHGGRIELDAPLPRGARFSIQLPKTRH